MVKLHFIKLQEKKKNRNIKHRDIVLRLGYISNGKETLDVVEVKKCIY